MAEAHSAVGFSFSVTHEGLNVSYNQELLEEIWHYAKRSYKRRAGRFKNNFLAGIYPATPSTLLFVILIVTGFSLLRVDLSCGGIPFLQRWILGQNVIGLLLASVLFSVIAWLLLVQLMRNFIKALLCYKGWMNDRAGRKPSDLTKLWMLMIRTIAKSKPLLYSFQGALPRMPVPSLRETLDRHLVSMKPLLNSEQYAEMARLSDEFESTVGPKFQRYLYLKSWLAPNYVTDWWEKYVYLSGRAPIMVNSNYYGMDTILFQPTTRQASRAANLTSCFLEFRRLIDRQELAPIMVFGVPLCSSQYERMFNTCRLPGVEHDSISHWKIAHHVAVFCRGCWWKFPIDNGRRLLTPAELERNYEEILNSQETPSNLEDKIAVMTAGERVGWANFRAQLIENPANRTALHIIERSAFSVILDDEAYRFDKNDSDKLDHWAHAMLHGNGCNRWFDKTINLIVGANGKVGSNCEHAWADAPVVAHLMEWALIRENTDFGYGPDGRVVGTVTDVPPKPTRIKWQLPDEVRPVILEQERLALELLNSVEMRLLVFRNYGKGFMKKCRLSPDGYLQMALQLANHRDQGKFVLTYEASMTRLFREGRTETVRTVSEESCAFVRSMDDPTATDEDRIRLLRDACEKHQMKYVRCMVGMGIDRHLFALYVVSKYLEIDSPFLKAVVFEPWRLSTSQTPTRQTTLPGASDDPQYVSAGGGFGPVADDGYGVSYIIGGEDCVSFHISSKKTCPTTSSYKFREILYQSLLDMHKLMEPETRKKAEGSSV